MVLNSTFNNISAISWQSILLVEETRGPRENHRTIASHWQTYHIMMYTSPWSGFELTTSKVIGTDCTCSCKSNYTMWSWSWPWWLEIVKYYYNVSLKRGLPSYKVTFSLQKGWPYKRRTNVCQHYPLFDIHTIQTCIIGGGYCYRWWWCMRFLKTEHFK